MTRKTVLGLLTAYVITAAVALVLLVAAMNGGVIRFSPADAVAAPFVLGVAVVVALAFVYLVIGIGIFVHHDARQRGMEPALWTVVAVLVPYFIGLVAYLVARQSHSRTCAACGAGVPADARYCPHCGAELAVRCPSCDRQLPEGASYCPSCGTALQGRTPDR